VILLDTNVLSALMRDPPDAAVVGWLDAQVPEQVWTTAVSAFEVRFGLARMAEGRRRRELEVAFEALLRDDLAGRVASLDRAAAEAAGLLAARREAAGRTVDVRDTLIGGIALARRMAVATRNVRHFDDLETGILDPWAVRTGS
jgi:predicted nucleic acid-binding protein